MLDRHLDEYIEKKWQRPKAAREPTTRRPRLRPVDVSGKTIEQIWAENPDGLVMTDEIIKMSSEALKDPKYAEAVALGRANYEKSQRSKAKRQIAKLKKQREYAGGSPLLSPKKRWS